MQFDAHAAEADALATLRVLEGQFGRYPDLPRNIEDLDRYCNPREPDWADRTGKLRWVNGEIVLNFGKRKGETLRAIVREDPGFAKWIARGDFPRDTRAIVLQALEGKWPERT
jgi:DNA polymerase-3 subunit epsilon